MRHVPDGVLRRLDDEPLAIPDRVTAHVDGCARCRARRTAIAGDTERVARLLAAPHPASPAPDADLAWARLRRDLHRGRLHDAAAAPRPRPAPALPARRPRLPRLSWRSALLAGACATVIAATAAAATLTTIFTPTHVAPVSLSQGDLQAISDLVGLGHGQSLGGFSAPTGSAPLRFGTLRWSSTGAGHAATSRAQAATETGLAVSLPSHLPNGVTATPRFLVQPRVSATVTFNAAAAPLTGTSVSVEAGPAVVTEYPGALAGDVPALGVAVMRRPTATSTGAGLNQIEAFLLRQPGVPAGLAEEVRLLGDLRTIFPVPVPPGASIRSVRIGGWPGVLLTDGAHVAAAAVWEDGQGRLHAVAGLLDPQDVLSVARQVG